MADFRSQLRQHYDSQALSTDKAEAILARGREAADSERVIPFPEGARNPWRKMAAIAAAVTILAGLAALLGPSDPGPVPFAEIAPHVIGFFGDKPKLESAPQEKTALRAWQLAHGAPPEFRIPDSLMRLESAACQVVDVHGRKLYLSCYWMENKPDRGDHDLVHLLVARRGDFSDAPSSSQPEVREVDGWSFASWAEGDILYTMATAAPVAKLRSLLARWDGCNQEGGLFVAWISR